MSEENSHIKISILYKNGVEDSIIQKLSDTNIQNIRNELSYNSDSNYNLILLDNSDKTMFVKALEVVRITVDYI